MSSFVPSYLDEKARAYIQMAQEDRARIVIDANLSVDFKDCNSEVLDYFLIKYGFDFVDWMTTVQKRALLSILWQSKKGTIGFIQKLLTLWDGKAFFLERNRLLKYDAKYQRDGSINRNTYRMSGWYQFSIRLSRPSTVKQKNQIEKLIQKIKPVRSELIEFDIQTFIGHDGQIKRNGNYNYGGYING
jgi:hypothetical protein